MKKYILTDLKKEDKLMVNIRISKEEKKILDKKAKMYANGNITSLLKYLILTFEPSSEELSSMQ